MIESHKTVITGGTAGEPVVAMGGIDASNGGRGLGVIRILRGLGGGGGLGKFNRDVTKILQ